MKITIVAANGADVSAEAHEWLCALIAILSPEQQAKLLSIVDTRVVLDGPGAIGKRNGHIISVPGIASGEQFGRLGG